MMCIGLLRAVNVGGKNTIPMADLRSALQDIELDHVRTYIQAAISSSNQAGPDVVAALDRYTSPGEQYRVVGRDVYLLLPNGTARSKLVAQVQKLGPLATVRNWKTVQKLQAMTVADQNDA